jgi:hypothetical protein
MTPATRRDSFVDVLSRHGADLSRLRGSRGVIPCLFHDDRHPSLSLDLDRGLFNCFACGARGGVLDLRRLLGEETAIAMRPGRRPPPASTLQQTRRRVMEAERRAEARRAEWAPWHVVNDYAGRCRHAVRDARQIATLLGPEDLRTWSLLARAAAVEREGLALEAELDALAVGRLQ